MVALSVNLNKIALIRNSREGHNPDLDEFARLALEAGAAGITVHPRPDQRHIRADDLPVLASLCAEHGVELNIEGNPFAGPRASSRSDVGDYPGFLALVEQIRPAQCTLVPDGDAQLTSDHGFDLHRDGERLRPIIQQLHQWNCRVSLFMDPLPEAMTLAAAIGADRIELYTGPFAEAVETGSPTQRDALIEHYRRAAQAALDAGLGVNAGHDLNLHNIPLMRDWPGLLEVSIGHALTVDALHRGFAETVRAYQQTLAVPSTTIHA